MKLTKLFLAGRIFLTGMFLAFFLFCSYKLYKTVSWSFSGLPKPYTVEMPKFAGRIFADSEIMPGTFTVERNFEEVSNWGGDGILTYPNYAFNGFYFRAWRPDSITEGIFQYAEKEIKSPKSWDETFRFGAVEKKQDKIIIFPERNPGVILLNLIGRIILLGIAFICLVFAIPIKIKK